MAHNSTENMKDEQKSFWIERHDVLGSDSAQYLVIDLVGEGSFGIVAKCLKLATGNTVAVKIHKRHNRDIEKEIRILEVIHTVDPDEKNIVKFIDSFQFQKMPCLVFEMLDKSIWKLMKERRRAPMSLNSIRTITYQLLVALDALKGLDIVHADLKPDNIMLVNHSEQPFKIKLIDFGLAFQGVIVENGTILQPRGYRAPELYLDLPITTAIDMWSLACVMTEMYFGHLLFPNNCDYNWMKVLVHLLGRPDTNLLAEGRHTWKFFTLEKGVDNKCFRFNSKEEYKEHTGYTPRVLEYFVSSVKSLDELILSGSRKASGPEKEDRIAFLSLLKCMLNVDAAKRISPREALNHSFLTMSHLVDKGESRSYRNASVQLMTVCHQCKFHQSADQSQDNKTPTIQEDRSHQTYYTASEQLSSPSPLSSHPSICGSSKENMDEEQANIQIERHDVIGSDSAQYLVMNLVGEGSFGIVAKCLNLATGNTVAVKIHKRHNRDIEKEVDILEVIDTVYPDEKNIVKFIDSFQFQKMPCLVFEMLDKSIWKLMKERCTEPMSLNSIRTITYQLLVALDALKGLDIVHADLKPDNIMLVNHSEQPFKIKLIDFGLAFQDGIMKDGTILQPRCYRAPEVYLGLPITTAIDMWSLACVMAEMYFGEVIFPNNCDYNWMKVLVHLLGQPDTNLLAEGRHTWKFFTLEKGVNNKSFRFNSKEEYKERTDYAPRVTEYFFSLVKTLDELILSGSRKASGPEKVDRIAFLSLLKCMLNVDAAKRISPGEALNHSFLTMSHLVDKGETRSYRDAAVQLMTVCHQCNFHQSADQSQDNKTVTVQEDRNYQTSHSASEQLSSPSPLSSHPSICGVSEENMDEEQSNIQIERHDVLVSDSAQYLVMDLIRESFFGIVAKCLNLATGNTVAVKIPRHHNRDIENEVDILQMIDTVIDPDEKNIAKFIDSFQFQKMPCLVFKMLDKSIWKLMKERRRAPMSLNSIRTITYQLLVALDALKGLDIVHANLKPDNIMLVNHSEQPFKIKLIDFGLAFQDGIMEDGTILQPRGYRAPEVYLGLPITTAIDMWSLACVMAEMYFGEVIFPNDCDYTWMKVLVHLLGQPDTNLLAEGRHTWTFFTLEKGVDNKSFRFNSQKEYKDHTGYTPRVTECFFSLVKTLDELILSGSRKASGPENLDRIAFLSLLKCMLNVDAAKRISPGEALNHSFLTMSHLVDKDETTSYRDVAVQLMTVCHQCNFHQSADQSQDNKTATIQEDRSHQTFYTASEQLSSPSPVSSHPSICGSSKENMDEEQANIPIERHDVIGSDSAQYLMMNLVGEGSFGIVAKCLNLATGNTVAVKIHKRHNRDIEKEVDILEVIDTVYPDEKNIVKFIDSFQFQKMPCLVFEMLDKSIWKFMKERCTEPMSLNSIRTITYQLLVALDSLKGLDIVHADLKPDNIMLVNHSEQPFKIKLIDFGLAFQGVIVEDRPILKPRCYRAPEVYLDLPITTAIDMWSLACVMTEMYFGHLLFPNNCDYNWMKVLVHLLGQPDTNLLAEGRHTWKFFTLEKGVDNKCFRFNSQEEYKEHTGYTPRVTECFFSLVKTLDELILSGSRKASGPEKVDRIAFLSLLKCMLNVDAAKRISPGEALNHTFLTMSHLVDKGETRSYRDAAVQLMTVCHQCNFHQSADQSQDNKTVTVQEDRNYQTSHSASEQLSSPSPLSCHIDYTDDQLVPINSGQGEPHNDPSDGAAHVTTPSEDEHVRTRPSGPPQKTFSKRVRQFFRRVRKRLATIFICGVNQTD